MPSISSRGIEMPSSPIRRLVPYAEAAKKRGVTVYHLNIGQPDIKTPEEAIAAIRNFDQTVIEYSHSAGIESYRRELAKYYQRHSIDVDHDDIIITTGGSEAILISFLTCFNQGDEIIVPEPYYANYNAFAVSAGVKIVPITSTIDDGFALPNMMEFESKITAKTRAIFICNPNNPTGYLYSKEELFQLREIVLKYDLYLFCDEVYREFCYDGAEHFSAMRLGIDEHVILVDSVSKRYSECGVRIGALVSKNKQMIATALKFGQARLSPPTLGQIVGEASLSAPQSYHDRVYREYLSRRNCVIEGLNKIPGVKAPMPKGAFYTLVSLPVDDAEDFCIWMLEKFEYHKQTVMFAPASGFYATPGLGKNQIRIAYVLNVEDLKKALTCLAEAIKVYPGRLV